jgi:release factor glutamine methyltransferase
MKVNGIILKERPHVYPVREDSLLLATSATVMTGENVVEIGCGLGLASIAAAREGAKVTATDINPYALRSVREEARHFSLNIGCVRTSLFRGLRTFEVVLFNPPYLPTKPDEVDPDHWHDVAVNGGADGWAVLDRFLSSLPEHLTPYGRAYVLLAAVPGMTAEPLSRINSTPGLTVKAIAGERKLEGERLLVAELVRDQTSRY